MNFRLLPGIAILVLIVTVQSKAESTRVQLGNWAYNLPLAESLATAPVIRPQDDGTVYLNPEAAVILKWGGSDAGGPHFLKAQDGKFMSWYGTAERPCWRFSLSKGGTYDVIVNRALDPKSFLTLDFVFWGPSDDSKRAGFFGRRVPPTQGWDDYQPWAAGRVTLTAGEHDFELRPQVWFDLHHLFNLEDIRLVPANDEIETAMAPIFQNGGINQKIAAKRAEESDLNQRVRDLAKTDFSTFKDYSEFLAYDKEQAQVLAAVAGDAGTDAYILDLKRSLVASRMAEFSDAEKAAATAWTKRINGDYRGTVATQPEWGKTLFATGHLDSLAPLDHSGQPVSLKDKPRVQLNIPAPPDLQDRMKRFAGRDSDAQLAELCHELDAALKPGTQGIEGFEAEYKAGHYAGALGAFRAFFFDALAHPEAHGASSSDLTDEGFLSRDKVELLRYCDPYVLEKNLKGDACILTRDQDRVIEAHVGEPGGVPWAPAVFDLPPGVTLPAYRGGPARDRTNGAFWGSPDGKAKTDQIAFYRGLNEMPPGSGPPGMFPALLSSYAISGNKEHLERYCAYLDDWCLNSQDDLDNSPINVRSAAETDACRMLDTLTMLRIILDERPEFAQDFPAPTLARYLLKAVTYYAPYTIRARRSEQANWGIYGVGCLLKETWLLNEFKVMDYFGREAWRLAQINFIQHRSLDGENIESWDTGHDRVDEYLYQEGFQKASSFIPEMDSLNQQLFLDNVRVAHRNFITHMSPEGLYWSYWIPKFDPETPALKTMKTRILFNDDLSLISDEPEVAGRMDGIIHPDQPQPEISSPSEIQPYGGYAFLRDHWGMGSDFLWMQDWTDHSQDEGSWFDGEHILRDYTRTCYAVARNGRVLMDATALAVDGKPPNINVGKIETGGKTEFCGASGRQVIPARFYTSARFDVAESLQDSPYALKNFDLRNPTADWYGFNSTGLSSGHDGEGALSATHAPIREVKAWRQVYHVRGENIFLVGDRIENSGSENREYTQFFTLPTPVNEDGFADRVRVLNAAGIHVFDLDPKAKRLRSGNVCIDNVSIYMAGHDLKFAGATKGDDKYEPLPNGSLPAPEMVGDRAHPGRLKPRAGGPNLDAAPPISARWSGTGNQALATLVLTRAAGDTVDSRYGNDLKEYAEMNGANGIAGCRAVTAFGGKLWFQIGPDKTNPLTAGPAEATAESLLAYEKNGGLSGIVLGGSEVTLNGKSFHGPANDFEYVLAQNGSFTATAIHTPIDTVQILPEASAFTKSVDVSFTIPTQDTSDIEYHYTLDGTDPTLQSPLYQGPFSVTQTTMVKVRPFRKELTETPWAVPGVDAGKTIAAIFRKEDSLPAVSADGLKPGLNYHYFEGPWTRLFGYAADDGVLVSRAEGTAGALLDDNQLRKIRKTDRAYAVRYDGYINVPASGVYQFYAPNDLYSCLHDPGYDLRVFIDGKEWFPSPTLHEENKWSVPLDQGAHRFRVAYVDYRWKTFRNEYWMDWQEGEMGQGTPVLNVSGPGIEKESVPSAWLNCLPDSLATGVSKK